MLEWIDLSKVDPITLGLVSSVVVPLVIAWYRWRKPVSDIRDSLSASEARFRADLILRETRQTGTIEKLREDNMDLRLQVLKLEALVNKLILEGKSE